MSASNAQVHPMSIVIAGAGIGGLSAALALANDGHKVVVIERAGEIREVGAGLQISPNGFRALHALGVSEQVDAIAYRPAAIELRDSLTGAQLASQALGDAFEQRFGYPYRVAHRADLQSALLHGVRSRADRIEVRLGQELVDFRQDEKSVEVMLANGDSVRADALVGADGLWSRNRGILHGHVAPRVTGIVAYRAVLPSHRVPDEILTDNVQVWMGPNHHLVCYKLRDGSLFNVVANFGSSRVVEGWESVGDPEELRAAYTGAGRAVQRILNTIADWRMWVLCDREPMANWGAGRVTLLGDAAHPMLPFVAQGACMSIEDAVQLGRDMRRHGADIPAAFRAYERNRAPRTSSVQFAAREAGEAYHADGKERERRIAAMANRPEGDFEANAWLFDSLGPRSNAGVASQTGLFGGSRTGSAQS